MSKNAVPVNATGLSSRRTVLQGLAVAPVALAIPAAILPSAAGAVSPDAALIAQAVAVETLAIRANAALDKVCDLDGEVERLMPRTERPTRLERPDDFTLTVLDEADGSRIIRTTPKPVDPAALLAHEQSVAAIASWATEREAVARRVGHDAADLKYHRLWRRLEVETRKLTEMVPTTIAGVTAKARAAITVTAQIDYDPGALNDWEYDIRTSALRDVVAIGGAA